MTASYNDVFQEVGRAGLTEQYAELTRDSRKYAVNLATVTKINKSWLGKGSRITFGDDETLRVNQSPDEIRKLSPSAQFLVTSQQAKGTSKFWAGMVVLGGAAALVVSNLPNQKSKDEATNAKLDAFVEQKFFDAATNCMITVGYPRDPKSTPAFNNTYYVISQKSALELAGKLKAIEYPDGTVATKYVHVDDPARNDTVASWNPSRKSSANCGLNFPKPTKTPQPK